MSTPPKQPMTDDKATKPNNKRRREHPLFTTNDAVKRAQQHAKTNPPHTTPLPPHTNNTQPNQPTTTTTKTDEGGTYAATRPDTVTANGAPTFSTSGSPPLDLFFNGLVRGCDKEKLYALLTASWASNPRTTLQLIAHSRDCRHGKGERLVSLHSLLYLRTHKPLTYLSNLLLFINCGYFKDLLLLARMVEASGGEKLGESELIELEVLAEFIKFDAAQLDRKSNKKPLNKAETGKDEKDEKDEKHEEDEDEEDGDDYVLVEDIKKLSARDDEDDKASGKDEKDVKMDEKDDEQKTDKPTPTTTTTTTKRRTPRMLISLAAKWAPSEGSHFDASPSRFAHRLARLLYPHSSHPMPAYRKVLGRLRGHLAVVEKQMCAGQWEDIQFDRVPSKAHALLKQAFGRHQQERYAAYLAAVKSGDKKVNVTGLQPHDLTKAYRNSAALDDTTEVQWTALVDRTKASGKLTGAVAVVDVSGSMESGRGNVQPIDPAIALGLLVANVAVGPFAKRVLTFHSEPSWFVLPTDSLHAQVNAVKAAPWGGNTNLQATFDLILSLAVQHSIPASEMPATLFIFSDMQFDAACGSFSVTNYEVIATKYRLAGYAIPNVVFWNLAGGHGSDAPVKSNEAGVAMLSGYSGELLKLIVDGADLTPESIMLTAVEKYDVVVEDAEL